jgi:ribose transport system permease protein
MARLVDRVRAALASPGSSNLTILGLLVAMIVAFTILTPPDTFLSSGNVQSIALQGAKLLIMSAGVTLLLISGGIDLSVGAIAAFSGVVAAKVMVGLTADLAEEARLGLALWGPVVLGVTAATVTGLVWGSFNGLVVVRTRVPPFIATLASSTIIMGLAQVWTGGLNVSGAPVELQNAYGLGKFLGVPWPVVTAAMVAFVLWVVLAKTRFGLRTYAIGAHAEASRRAGIPVGRHVFLVYALVGFLAGLIGAIDVARYTTATVTGYEGLALQAITAAVIGGTSLWGGRGRMSGTVVGAFIPATLTSGFVVLGVQPFWQNVAIGFVLLGAVCFDQYRGKGGRAG